MARKALVVKANKTPKFMTQHRNRCKECGRPRGFMRMFNLCRICFRNTAVMGILPGVKKASW